jgi:hypothetical protein
LFESSTGMEVVKRREGHMFKTFKLKAYVLNSKDNFFSSQSFTTLCSESQFSLQELTLKNARKLTKEDLLINLGKL